MLCWLPLPLVLDVTQSSGQDDSSFALGPLQPRACMFRLGRLYDSAEGQYGILGCRGRECVASNGCDESNEANRFLVRQFGGDLVSSGGWTEVCRKSL